VKPAQPKIAINLLTQDEFSQSFIGKILLWTLSVGRYIVVFTELIVILSFLSRFKLDRDLTDINESIEKQKRIIESYAELEQDFRLVQSQLDFVADHHQTYDIGYTLNILKKTLPPDVRIESVHANDQGFTLSATALSMSGFAQFVQGLQRDNAVADVALGKVLNQNQGLNIEFELVTNYK
jgi:Tfp pilus assembly protein PilN